jgi:hypothetical protein
MGLMQISYVIFKPAAKETRSRSASLLTAAAKNIPSRSATLLPADLLREEMKIEVVMTLGLWILATLNTYTLTISMMFTNSTRMQPSKGSE